MSTLLERYLAGEHAAVYDELVAGAGDAQQADAVARAMMRIVRKDLEMLVERWRARGFTLANPLGRPGEARSAVAEIEEKHGPLPPTLRALYRELAYVDFVEAAPDDAWPGIEDLDPLQLYALGTFDDDDDGEHAIHLFSDPLMKFGISGVGTVYVPLPARGFDAETHFEGSPIGRLVPYLREAILERGGFGMKSDGASATLSRELTEGLLPF